MVRAAALVVEGVETVRGAGAGAFRLTLPRLALAQGEAVVVTGPSGCGKSTMLDLLGLVLKPRNSGRFLMAGADGGIDVKRLWEADDHDRLARLRATRIGYVLQTGGLLPFLTVAANLRLSLSLQGRKDEPMVARLVEALGLAPLLAKMPQALSIGERQRVAIARALAHRPALLLADEPTASLDPGTAEAVMELMLALVAELGITALVVSHDWELMQRFGLRRIQAEPQSRGPDGAATVIAG